MNLASGFHRDIQITILPSISSSRGDSIRVGRILGDIPGSRFARGIRDDLEIPRYIPIGVDGMVRLGRDYVERDVMGLSVCKDRDERSEVKEVCRQIQGTV